MLRTHATLSEDLIIEYIHVRNIVRRAARSGQGQSGGTHGGELSGHPNEKSFGLRRLNLNVGAVAKPPAFRIPRSYANSFLNRGFVVAICFVAFGRVFNSRVLCKYNNYICRLC
jgi:hypothetical protein